MVEYSRKVIKFKRGIDRLGQDEVNYKFKENEVPVIIRGIGITLSQYGKGSASGMVFDHKLKEIVTNDLLINNLIISICL